MRFLRDLSIRNKLQLLLIGTAGFALFLALAASLSYDAMVDHRQFVNEVQSISDVLSENAKTSLAVADHVAAVETLASLQLNPAIVSAQIVDNQGRLVAGYSPTGRHEFPGIETSAGHWFGDDGLLHVARPISDGSGRLGTLYVQAATEPVRSLLLQNVVISTIMLLVSLTIAVLVSWRWQATISAPIQELAQTAESVTELQNYSIRVTPPGDDEIGALYCAFNSMLQQIEFGQQQLQQTHEQMESHVAERTNQLLGANRDLRREIVDRKRAEEELRSLQQRHIETARQAGMAEIAASVLHNVGNVLNSVNVASNMVHRKVEALGVDQLRRAAELVEQHRSDLATFVSEHPQGKHLPQFLTELSKQMLGEQEALSAELKNLEKNIEHINEIITVQQTHASFRGYADEVSLPELIEDAIRINSATLARQQVSTYREFEKIPPLLIDKQKVLQIVVNLLSNAKQALIDSDSTARSIFVRLKRIGSEVVLEVEDNGVGISPENLTRIFSHGFTTKETGHGFGLHGSALFAKGMGGNLTVESNGPGQGARFTLTLPYRVSDDETTPAITAGSATALAAEISPST